MHPERAARQNTAAIRPPAECLVDGR